MNRRRKFHTLPLKLASAVLAALLLAHGGELFWGSPASGQQAGRQSASPAFPPTTRHVPGQYNTIQTAIDSSQNGDTILVAPGIYTGFGNRDLDFNGTDLVLLSELGPDTTIIDCQGLGRGIIFDNFEDNTSVMDGFTITNGTAVDGGGMYFSLASPIVRNCKITFCAASNRGGGLYVNTSSAKIQNCTISGNSSTAEGGGCFVAGGSPEITNCTISNNAASTNGAGIYDTFSTLIVSTCTISGNIALFGSGGGAYVRLSDPSFQFCRFSQDSASVGGGAIYFSGSSAFPGTLTTVVGCTLSSNVTLADGGAINFNNSSPFVLDCIISNNRANQHGGGIHAWQNARPTIFGCTLSNNTATFNGGGVSTAGADIILTNSTITNNQGSSGAGVHLNSEAMITNCTITANVTTGASGSGGGVKVNGGDPVISDCTIAGNTAYWGGGIRTESGGNGTFIDCTIVGNKAAEASILRVQPFRILPAARLPQTMRRATVAAFTSIRVPC